MGELLVFSVVRTICLRISSDTHPLAMSRVVREGDIAELVVGNALMSCGRSSSLEELMADVGGDEGRRSRKDHRRISVAPVSK